MNSTSSPSAANHPASWPVEHLLAECEIKRTRASGPGGQHRNKVETAIVITHLPSKIVGQASERRSQDLNRQMAVQRLRVNLAVEVRSLPDVLSPLWLSRSHGGKISISESHADFPAILAEALDHLAAHHFDHSATAAALQISGTQLVGLLSQESRALEQLNEQRKLLGLKPLVAR